MPNPFKTLRLSRGWTHESVAFKTRLSRLAVIRNEQAVFTNPAPTLLKFFSHEFDLLPEDVTDSYHSYQSAQRELSYDSEVLLPHWLTNSLPTTQGNPCFRWRAASGISKARISTAFCIHPAVVSKIELKPHIIIGDLPEQYLTALAEAGYAEDSLELLNEKFKEYIKKLNEETSLRTRVGQNGK